MVLDRAEVVHLRAAGEVQRHLLGAATLARQACLGAGADVLAAECHGCQQGRGIAFADGLLVADLPGVDADLVDGEVLHPSRLGGTNLEHRDHECPVVVRAIRRDEVLHDGDLAVGSGVDDQPGEDGRAVTGDVVRDDDGLDDHLARRDADHDG